MGDQEFLGVVAADHVLETPTPLAEDELTLLEALATLAGAQLANQRLYAQLEEKNRDLEFHVRELTVVGELTRILNRAKEPEAVARQMLWLLADTLGADYGFMFLYQAKDHSLSLVGSHGLDRQRQEDWTLLKEVEARDLLALEGQYADGAQAGLDKLLPGLEGPVILRDLSNRQRPVGIWGLGRRDAARPFHADDEKLLATADEQILVALTSLRLRLVAATDYLTGLFTRAKFTSALEKEISSSLYLGQPLGLVLLDVDHFKDINDTHGHLAGDQVLADLGQVLNASTRQGDICARIGGEEFAVLLPAVDLPRALAAAEKLRQRVSQKVTHHRGQDLAITVSLGVAVMEPGRLLEPDDLVQRADQALYRAKRGGRNRVEGYLPGSGEAAWGILGV
jgi:diguanylate cyclase (GGDEF)-like protein